MKVEKKRINIINFGEEYAGLTNSALFEKIYVENDVVTNLKKSENLYVFELFDDVSVEVLFKEILTNPKTGGFNPITFIPAIMVLGMCVYFIKSCEKSYEL